MDPRDLPSRYVYLGETHAGGQAEVHICNDSYLDRKVAIKFYSSGADRDEFLQEVKSLTEISSLHVAELYDLVPNPSGLPGIVQEFVSGSVLDGFSATTPSLDAYLRVIYQIACGISDLHGREIVHRDIKPHNMRFDSEGVVKILDFGLSVNLSPSAETVVSRGTFGFRAPEFYHTAPVAITYAMDVYAFGATAWFLAEGGLPDVLREIPPMSSGLPPLFSTLHPEFAGSVSEILDQCLQSDPSNRPRMEDVRDVLEQFLLRGQHRAEMVSGATRHVLNNPGEVVRLRSIGLGEIVVLYDGFRFIVESVSGLVFVNNMPAYVGQELPGSCVLTLGGAEAGYNRQFVPFNVSHPEVVI
ncbi:MAG TPA: serine/threonine-protein kinase [Pseudomonadales bacterium]